MSNYTPQAEPAPDPDLVTRLGLGHIARPRLSRKQWIFAGIGLVVLVIVLRMMFGGTTLPPFVTQPVTHGALLVTVSATGTLAPRNQVDVGAEVSGRIDAILVDFNDHVKKGQVLARINTDQLLAQLAQARANLAQARATQIQTSHTATRYASLVKNNALSKQQLDIAQGDSARASAGVSLAQAQVQADETSLAKATIFSPIDGVVLDRKVSAGQTVVAAMTTPVLFTLASDLSQMELDVDIDEADIGQIKAGAAAEFTVDAYPSRKFSATLISIHNAPKTVQGVVTYEGVLLVANPGGLLKPGMTATAEIRGAQVQDAMLVPNGALRFTPPNIKAPALPAPKSGVIWGRVWTAEGGKPVAHDIKLGVSDGHMTVMLAGDLHAGEATLTSTASAVPPAPSGPTGP